MSDAPEIARVSSADRRPRRARHTTQQVRDRRRRIITYALLTGSIVLMISALVGENGYLATLRARRDQQSLLSEIVRLRHENQDYLDRIHRLKSDAGAIEDEARRELGLVRPGETLVIVRDARPALPGKSDR